MGGRPFLGNLSIPGNMQQGPSFLGKQSYMGIVLPWVGAASEVEALAVPRKIAGVRIQGFHKIQAFLGQAIQRCRGVIGTSGGHLGNEKCIHIPIPAVIF